MMFFDIKKQKQKMYDKNSRNVILLAGIGAVLEFYDFVLYMIFSKEISATFFAGITNVISFIFIF